MNVVALVVAVVSALAAVAAVVYARRLDSRVKEAVAAAGRSAAAAERSASASESRAQVEADRRHDEMTPLFRVAPDPPVRVVGGEVLHLVVLLTGPAGLGRLDSLTVRIRDDRPSRAEGSQIAGGPSPEQLRAQVWGPYRFAEGSDADVTGRVIATPGMPVGESLRFVLEPTQPPSWSSLSAGAWLGQVGSAVRLELVAEREGWEPWSLTCELEPAHPGWVSVGVP